MTIDDHTAAQATRSITSGISDLKEMLHMGRVSEVSIELDKLSEAITELGDLIYTLGLKEVM